MKRFVVVVESPSKEESSAMHDWIRSNRWGWWHWMEPLWLLVDGTDKASASSIRDKAKEIFPEKPVMVFDVTVDSVPWAGFNKGKTKDGKSPFAWMKSSWANKKNGS